jgi:glycosyltransferase involved in cell wall biosynthesis
MKLIHILGDSKWGGGTAVVFALAQLARDLGWQADLLTTDPQTAGHARASGFGVVDLDVIRRRIRPLTDLAGLAQLTAFLRRSGYGIVHTHTTKAGFVGRLAARFAGIPGIVHTVHGFAFHEQSPRLQILGHRLLEIGGALCCHRLVTVSRFHRRWAIDLRIAAAHRVTAIPNGIPDLVCSTPRDAVRNALGVDPGQFVVLNHGRLAPQKGLEDLLAAVPLLASSDRRRLLVLLAGDGPLRVPLAALARSLGIAGHVRFLGFRSDVAGLLGAADAVVLPSHREGLSISLLEAMAAGRPIAAASIGSMREATGDGASALLFPPGDRNAIAGAIHRLMAEPSLASALAARAREAYLERYTLDRMIAGYRSLYLELAQPSTLSARGVAAQAGRFAG